MARFMRARGLRRTTPRCGSGRSTTSAASGRRSGTSSTSAASTARRWRTRRCPARPGSRARRSTTPSACSAASPATGSRSATRRSRARSATWTWDELRAQTAAIRAGLAARGVGRGDRVAAYLPEHPRDDRGLPRHGVARRDLVVGGARVRQPQRDRPLRADRAEGAARDRRLPLRRQGLRPARGRRGDRGGDRRAEPVTLGYLDGVGLGGRLPPATARSSSSRSRSTTRSGSSTRQRHDRAAQGDRAGAGRDPARAPQEDVPAPRRAARTTACSGSPRRAG